MTLQANKALVARFIEAMRTSDTAALTELTTKDFTWWIIGKPEYLATAGEHDRDFFLGFFGGGASNFPDGVDFAPTSLIAEGDKVAAEAVLRAKTATGALYDNAYHFAFVVEDGRIKRMKEYMDTHHAKTTFGL